MSVLPAGEWPVRVVLAFITGLLVLVVMHLDWWRHEDVAIFLLAVGVSLLAGVIDLLEHRR